MEKVIAGKSDNDAIFMVAVAQEDQEFTTYHAQWLNRKELFALVAHLKHRLGE
ncbi:MAG: hypothetical protein WBQ86_12670 [Candidatus Binatus sp.]